MCLTTLSDVHLKFCCQTWGILLWPVVAQVLPRWVVYHELVLTTKEYMRQVCTKSTNPEVVKCLILTSYILVAMNMTDVGAHFCCSSFLSEQALTHTTHLVDKNHNLYEVCFLHHTCLWCMSLNYLCCFLLYNAGDWDKAGLVSWDCTSLLQAEGCWRR